MKVQAKELEERRKMEILDALYTAAGSVRGRSAMKLFLRDLLTESERIMFGRRILIARKLLSGASYREIIGELGVGQDTVQRVHHWLQDQLPGYEQAIQGMEKEYTSRQEKKLYAQSALYRLKRKYPLHFLLFPSPRKTKKS